MKFTKMHGLGNDFVLLYFEDGTPKNVLQLAVVLCNRHKGIGADGLVLITPSLKADVRMRIFNADGVEAEQCGNAIRCVAKYSRERLGIQKETIQIETRIGVRLVEMRQDGEICVDMGAPILKAKQIPVRLELDEVIGYPLEIEGEVFDITCVSMGNPHVVIAVPDVEMVPIEIWGPQLELHPLFPRKINVEFITIRSPHEVSMRVWERGVGRTQACGTGACAALVAGVLMGRLDFQVIVHLEGGDLKINWDREQNRVYMIGPATLVFEGDITPDHILRYM